MRLSRSTTSVLVAVIGLGLPASAAAEPAPPIRQHDLPPQARQVDAHQWDLGESTDPTTGLTVRGTAFVLTADAIAEGANRDAARGGSGGGKGGGGTGGEPTFPCYRYNQSGAIWRTAEAWALDVTGGVDVLGNPLDDAVIAAALGRSIATWEASSGTQILGDRTEVSLPLEAPTENGVNEIVFAQLQEGWIAINYHWGTYRGKKGTYEILEFDQVYNTRYAWSVNEGVAPEAAGEPYAGDANAMDFENIATHEVGHAIGLGHPTQDECGDADRWEAQTMYPASSRGEMKNRNLADGDLAGLHSLYGTS